MSGDLLQTKLYVPQLRPFLVPRPYLIAKLNNGLSGKLTLVSAPAGFGKTSLIADWIHQPPVSSPQPLVSWLSLDQYDDDPNRFWQYVLAALNTAVSALGTNTQQRLSSTPLPPPPALLTNLLNELADLSQPIILVLDDYHLIANQSIHDGIDFLLDHAPHQLHLVLITRADPPLALARLRGRGLLNEIRVADLRFSQTETAVFLRDKMHLPLSTDDIAALESRTEGWITGLHLTAVSLQGRTDTDDFIKNFTNSHFYILEYLAEEVLQQQPEDVQAFLLQTSILPLLSGPLCDAVTGRNDCQKLLIQLHRQNLFISPLDDDHNWFRTHHLLADLLNNHLQMTAATDEVNSLHRRAGEWCEKHGMWETAVSHAIETGDWEWVADLVSKAYHPLIAQGRIATWRGWLAQIPVNIVQTRPVLQVRQGWAAFLSGEIKPAETILKTARRSLIDAAASPQNQLLRGELATYLATLAFFREAPADIIEAAEEALDFLPPDALILRARATSALGLGVSLAGDTRRAMDLYHETAVLARTANNPFFLAHALEMVADGQYHTGQLQAAAATCREIIALGTKDQTTPLPFAGNGHIRLANILVEWRDLTEAEKQMTMGLKLSRQGGIGYNALHDQCIQVRLRHALGDQEGALAALRQAEVIVRRHRSRISAVQLASCAVQFWLHVGNVQTAVSWVEGVTPVGEPVPLDALPIIGQEVQQISLARVRLAQQRPDEVLAVYLTLREQAQAAGRMARVIEIGLLGALAYEMKGETAVAVETLCQTLALTQPQGYVQIFVESGEAMMKLLCQIPTAAHNGYINTLLNAFPTTIQASSTGLIEPLSPRELEVLHLITAGLSNKQIAAELIVTLNTVKKHSTHIYEKLGVNGRTQAIARARELNIM